ncbi:MAG TPA: VWA domain-containing protein [Casimicrobiaceae bacterium]|nr:VWA domain-containing protein [Casimicrobiaceae bacterium]
MLTLASSAAPAAALHARLAGFAGFLRANGFGVGADDSAGVVETAAGIGVFDGDILRWSLKALLCARGDEWRRFDALFDAYFLPPNRSAFVRHRDAGPGASHGAGSPEDAALELHVASAAEHAGAEDDGPGERHGASLEESLASTDFRDLHRSEELRRIEALTRRFARRMKHLRLRREARFHRGRRMDLQGTIRRSVASGGTPFRVAWKDRRRVRPRLVLLLDASRSMSPYSFFYLRLARALCLELADIHCFIFHTRLTAIDEALRDADPFRSQERLHLLASGWGGGTRIGECLQAFNRRHAPRLVHSRTAIIVVSDGYDTGEPAALGAALGELERRARRIVWLNPLLGRPDFTPESRGMQAALPHLDLFAPGADLASVERVLPSLIEALR